MDLNTIINIINDLPITFFKNLIYNQNEKFDLKRMTGIDLWCYNFLNDVVFEFKKDTISLRLHFYVPIKDDECIKEYTYQHYNEWGTLEKIKTKEDIVDYDKMRKMFTESIITIYKELNN